MEPCNTLEGRNGPFALCEVGENMDKKTIIEELARKAHEKGVFNGAWLYAEKGVIVSKGAVGFRDPDNKLPMQEDTIFEMASITKQFTATAIMLCVSLPIVLPATWCWKMTDTFRQTFRRKLPVTWLGQMA